MDNGNGNRAMAAIARTNAEAVRAVSNAYTELTRAHKQYVASLHGGGAADTQYWASQVVAAEKLLQSTTEIARQHTNNAEALRRIQQINDQMQHTQYQRTFSEQNVVYLEKAKTLYGELMQAINGYVSAIKSGDAQVQAHYNARVQEASKAITDIELEARAAGASREV